MALARRSLQTQLNWIKRFLRFIFPKFHRKYQRYQEEKRQLSVLGEEEPGGEYGLGHGSPHGMSPLEDGVGKDKSQQQEREAFDIDRAKGMTQEEYMAFTKLKQIQLCKTDP